MHDQFMHMSHGWRDGDSKREDLHGSHECSNGLIGKYNSFQFDCLQGIKDDKGLDCDKGASRWWF